MDMDQLIQIMVRFSVLILDLPEIKELGVAPWSPIDFIGPFECSNLDELLDVVEIRTMLCEFVRTFRFWPVQVSLRLHWRMPVVSMNCHNTLCELWTLVLCRNP